jgi:hypothetical protein
MVVDRSSTPITPTEIPSISPSSVVVVVMLVTSPRPLSAVSVGTAEAIAVITSIESPDELTLPVNPRTISTTPFSVVRFMEKIADEISASSLDSLALSRNGTTVPSTVHELRLSTEERSLADPITMSVRPAPEPTSRE